MEKRTLARLQEVWTIVRKRLEGEGIFVWYPLKLNDLHRQQRPLPRRLRWRRTHWKSQDDKAVHGGKHNIVNGNVIFREHPGSHNRRTQTVSLPSATSTTCSKDTFSYVVEHVAEGKVNTLRPPF